uniref:Putative secreted peptide n=1 Tax=Anopheles braziliensis TaxID=58242 RepID=A0A2M3ZSS8_9DIPT
MIPGSRLLICITLVVQSAGRFVLCGAYTRTLLQLVLSSPPWPPVWLVFFRGFPLPFPLGPPWHYFLHERAFQGGGVSPLPIIEVYSKVNVY